MRYPFLDPSVKRRVHVPQLKGGINAADHPSYINDNQLTACNNLYFDRHGLRTRPGVRFIEKLAASPHDFLQTEDVLWAFKRWEGNGEEPNLCAVKKKENTFEFFRGIYANFEDSDKSVNIPLHNKQDCFLRLSSRDYDSAGVGVDVTQISLKNGEIDVEYYHPVYIPTVMINSVGTNNPSDCPLTGDLFEGYNLLTDGFKVLATADGKAMAWKMPRQLKGGDRITVSLHDPVFGAIEHNINLPYVIDRSYDGSLSRYLSNPVEASYVPDGGESFAVYMQRVVYDALNNCVVFVAMDENAGEKEYGMHIPPVSVEGYSQSSSNFSITVTTTVGSGVEKILGMTCLCWFGGSRGGLGGGSRLFVGGNPDYPGVIYWSDLNKPTYFPENNYAYVGDSSPITALAQQSDLLVIFQDKAVTVAQYVQGETVTSDDVMTGAVVDITTLSATFPMTPLHSSIGCDCPDTLRLCANRLVWLNSDGKVYTLVNYGQYSQRNIRELSYLVQPLLKRHSAEELKRAISADMDGKYCLYVGNKVYVMDYDSAAFKSYTSYSSDKLAQKNIAWYEWTMPNFALPVKRGVTLGDCFVMVSEDDEMYAQSFNEPDFGWTDCDAEAQHPIPCSFTTKHFVFGSPDKIKNIDSVMLTSDTALSILRVDCLSDNDMLSAHFIEGGYENEMMRHRIYPDARGVVDFALRVSSDNGLSAEGVTLIYKEAGDIN